MSMPHEANTRRKSGGSVSKCRVCSAKQTALPAIWLGLYAKYANSWMVISARYSLKCRRCVCVCVCVCVRARARMSAVLIFSPRKGEHCHNNVGERPGRQRQEHLSGA